jgi:hypothetical protein
MSTDPAPAPRRLSPERLNFILAQAEREAANPACDQQWPETVKDMVAHIATVEYERNESQMDAAEWELDHIERSSECDRLAGEVRGLREKLESLPDKIRKCLEPGEGGINITGGVPSCVFIHIGRGDYENDYELAQEAAEEALEAAAATVEREIAALRAATPGQPEPAPPSASDPASSKP